MNKKLIQMLLASVALSALAGCSSISTAPDEAGLHYKGGPLSSTKFANCVKPGDRNFDGPSDPHYVYPAGQRTFNFAGGPGADSDPVTVVSKDNQQMTVAGVATFELRTDCENLRKFHEQIGLKYAAYTDAGWIEMLNTYIKQPLDRAMDQAAQGFGWKALYNDPATKAAWEAKVKELAPQFVLQTAGADFFENFALTIQKPQPHADLVQALAAEQKAIAENNAQKQRNEQITTELESIRALVKVLGPSGYILYKAIQDGKITVVPVPTGGNVVVQP